MVGVPFSTNSSPIARAESQAFAVPLPLLAALMVSVPVFLQAPWVRSAPMAAALFTVPLLTLGILLEQHGGPRGRAFGALLVGFCGSWLGGCLFWGWCRLHPLWHLPIEGFALPLALAGLGGRWRLAGAFYLASLLGTAATDAAMALTGVMGLWPSVLQASPAEAPLLLHQAAAAVLHPLPLTMVLLSAGLILAIGHQLWHRGDAARVAAAALLTTLAVDAVFLGAALLAPTLSGVI